MPNDMGCKGLNGAFVHIKVGRRRWGGMDVYGRAVEC